MAGPVGMTANEKIDAGPPQGLTRREAMIQLLRAGGIAAGAAGAGIWLSRRSSRPVPAHAEQARRDHRTAADQRWPSLTVVQRPVDPSGAVAVAGEPRALVRQALENLGGIQRFVGRQDVVVMKPNIAWDRTPEQAANTNPELVAEVVRQCWRPAPSALSSPTSVATRRAAAFIAQVSTLLRVPKAQKSFFPIPNSFVKSILVEWCSKAGPSSRRFLKPIRS